MIVECSIKLVQLLVEAIQIQLPIVTNVEALSLSYSPLYMGIESDGIGFGDLKVIQMQT